MKSLTFKGGIHPFEGKDLTRNKPLVSYIPKGDMVFPLSQHIGAPAKAAVKKGDRVLRGQVIGLSQGMMSVPVHASCSGTVKAVEPRRAPSGQMLESVVIENDGLFEEVAYTPAKLRHLKREEILERIQAGGVVGMGGAGFPTHVKLNPKEPEKIEYVLVNGAECEPYLTSDHMRMLKEPRRLVAGLKILLKLFNNAQGCICIEDNKPECIAAIQPLVEGESRISVKVLKSKYPQGAERNLIYAVTEREIDSSRLPADVGCIVDNVDTVSAIYQAVIEGKPVMSKIVTVTGDAIQNPINVEAPTGTNLRELVELAGGFTATPEKMIIGGTMMGVSIFDLDTPCTKTTAACLCFQKDPVSAVRPSACIGCGRCVEACPSHILPARLSVFADKGDRDAFLQMDGMECCECGSCSYVCPAKRDLTQSIRSMRRLILNSRKRG